MNLQYQSRRCLAKLLSGKISQPILVSTSCRDKQLSSGVQSRGYANPARFNLPAKIAFKPPPPPAAPIPSLEDGHEPGAIEKADGPFDRFLEETAESIYRDDATTVTTLYSQYRDRAGVTLDHVIPYEERPAEHRRADKINPVPSKDHENGIGDGVVMVIYGLQKPDGKLDKICACSGFVVNATLAGEASDDGDMVITCAHTLEQVGYSHIVSTYSDFYRFLDAQNHPGS